MEYTFTVPGVPAPQGSKEKWGAEANPRTRPWRAAISDMANQTMDGAPLLTGPVEVYASFVWTRPKAHFRTGKNAHLLRDDAPHFKSSTPDVDKCCRAAFDSLKGIVLHDDAQVAKIVATKSYGDRAGLDITIRELTVAIPATPTERNVP